MANVSWDRVHATLDKMRQEDRLKQNVDYCLTFKYSCIHILCQQVYKELIQERFAEAGIEITTLHTYE